MKRKIESVSAAQCPHRRRRVQMVSTPRVDDNLKTGCRLSPRRRRRRAARRPLPEYFPIMGCATPTSSPCAGRRQGAIQGFLAATARQHGIWLVGGSLPLRRPSAGKVLNTCLVQRSAGARVARYDKITSSVSRRAPSDTTRARRSELFATGRVRCPFGRVGLSICYDMRFPGSFIARRAFDLLLIPAAFTETTGRAHWEILLRARAIENQCYVLAAIGRAARKRPRNARQQHADRPWGDHRSAPDKGEGVVIGDVDHARIADVRASLPALKHRVVSQRFKNLEERETHDRESPIPARCRRRRPCSRLTASTLPT